jgi:hypothetical protein
MLQTLLIGARTRLRHSILPLAVVSAGLALPAQAATVATFTTAMETKVSQDDTLDQRVPRVGMSSSGGFVEVWHTEPANNAPSDMLFRIYDISGNPKTSATSVSPIVSANGSYDPDIAVAKDGSFVIAFSDSDDTTFGVYARRFDATGTALGDRFRVDQADANVTGVSGPAIAMAGDGSFVIAWTGVGLNGGASGIVARRFNADGSPKGDGFRVDSGLNDAQAGAAIASLSTGAFAIVWTSGDQNLPGSYLRTYDASGVAGAETNVGVLGSPHIVGTDLGSYVLAWADYVDPTGSVFAQRYSATGAASGAQVTVSQSQPDYDDIVSLSADHSGAFAVSWYDSGSSTGATTETAGIYLRGFDASNNPQIGETAVGDGNNSAVALDPNGDIVVAFDRYDYTSGLDRILFRGPTPVASTPGDIRFVTTAFSATEGGTNPDIKLVRENGNSGRVCVDIAYSGTATSGSDYTPLSTTPACWEDGVDGQIDLGPLAIIDDTIDEANETVKMTLSVTTGTATIGSSGGVATVTIIDNDPPPTLTLSRAKQTVTEGATGFVVLKLSEKSGKRITVKLTLGGTADAGTDYTAPPLTVVFPVGAVAKRVNFKTLVDSSKDGPETVTMTVGTPVNVTLGAAKTFTLTINNAP